MIKIPQVQNILSKNHVLVSIKHMKRAVGCFVVLFMMAACSTVNEPTIDYALEFDFREVSTFQYLDTPDSNAQSKLVNERIASTIQNQLITSGLQKVEKGADLFVTYHLTREDTNSFITTQKQLGAYGDWGPGWGRWGYEGPKKWRRWEYTIERIPTTRAYETQYAPGTIIFDAFEPETKNLVWRGTGLVNIHADPDTQAQQAEAILANIGQRWLRILANQGK